MVVTSASSSSFSSVFFLAFPARIIQVLRIKNANIREERETTRDKKVENFAHTFSMK